MPLTDAAIRQAKPTDKAFNLFDGGGLYVSVRPTGKKVWMCRFYISGKAGQYTIGEYPCITLSQARVRREEVKALAKEGINPNEQKKLERLRNENQRSNTFRAIAEDWYEERIKDQKSSQYQYNIRRELDKDILPALGSFPINEITSAQIYALMKKVEKRGAPVLAIQIKQYIGTIFRYAASTARIDAQYDPTALLKGAVVRPPIKHAKALETEEIRELLKRLSSYNGQRHILISIELLLLMFCRTVEIRRGEWKEVYWNENEWRIPEGKMKKKHPHIVPLSRQAKALLQELHAITGGTGLMVPSMIKPGQPISPTTINKAFEHMGYAQGVITGHDFRATAHTHLAGKGYNEKAIERQLAHIERDKTTRAYNHQQYLPERHRMMQDWADWIDTLRLQITK